MSVDGCTRCWGCEISALKGARDMMSRCSLDVDIGAVRVRRLPGQRASSASLSLFVPMRYSKRRRWGILADWQAHRAAPIGGVGSQTCSCRRSALAGEHMDDATEARCVT